MDFREYFINQLNEYLVKNDVKVTKKNRAIALIGLGPHAKRIYLHYIKKYKENLSLVVDLKSQKANIRKYLDDNGFKNTKIFCIDDQYKDNLELPKNIESNLLSVFKTFEITHIFISTEPKAHNMYLKFALKNDINVLTDKPITVTKNMTSVRSINKVRKQYYEILKLSENSIADCKVMCQRQYHRGYEYVKKLLNETVAKYQIPITYISIYHCDGNWEMMHDLDKENHPYKYGYGKLFHSGYHFIDLLSDFIKINNQLPKNKRIKHGEVYSNCFTPNDEKAIVNVDDYKRLFNNQTIPDFYNEVKNPSFKKYGEKNFYGLMKFTNSNNQLITEVNLNLLHYGFSRRGWIQSKNFYKENGRIRHESINIHVGPLMNIQVHSYQSKEIKDRTNDMKLEEQIGGLEHFEIHIYRNVDLIGGKPFEKIDLGDLYTEKEKKNILGYNELSREQYLNKFLNGKCDRGDIKDQALAIEILHSCAMGIHNYYAKKEQPETINISNEHIYPLNVKYLKQFSYKENIDQEKNLISYIPLEKNDYDVNIAINNLINKKSFETFITISDNKNAAGGLLYKEFKTKFMANIYSKYLNFIIKYVRLNKLIKKIENYK